MPQNCLRLRYHWLRFALCLCALNSAQAVVATYDGFDHYTAGAFLTVADDNGFGWDGGWFRDDLTNAPLAIARETAIAAPEGYVALSNHSFSPSGTGGQGKLARKLATGSVIDLSADGTYFFSTLVRRNSNQWQSLGWLSSTGNETALVSLTNNDQIRALVKNGSGTATNDIGGVLPGSDSDLLVVAKLVVQAAGNESFSVNVYRSASDTIPYFEPASWDVTHSAEMGTGSLDAAVFYPDARNSSPLDVEAVLMSEFRMATDWRDVIGAPRHVVYPADAGVLNVTAAPYNAAGDGVTDDTAAIQAAIHDAMANSENFGAEQIIYFPEGTYLVSDTLWGRLPATPASTGIPQFGLILQGESETGTTIQLADNTFTQTTNLLSNAEPVIWFGADGTEEGNDAFDNYLRDITIDTGSGNPGAVAVDFIGNNNAALRRVTLRSGDGQGFIGLDLRRSEQGPELFSRVTIDGFDYGIRTEDDRIQITIEDLTLRNQNTLGILSISNTIAIRLLRSDNSVPVLQTTGNESTVVLVDAELTGGSGGSALITTNHLYARDVVTGGYDRALNQDGLNVAGTTLSEYSSDAGDTLTSPAAHLKLTARQHPEFFDANLDNWANVITYGANPNDITDDSSAIQSAIDSGKSVIYFPTGTSSAAEYRAANPLYLRGKVRQLEGLFQRLDAFDGGFGAESPVQTLLTIQDGPGLPLFINDISLDVVSIWFHWRLRHASSRDLVMTNVKQNLINEREAGDLYGANLGGAPILLRYPQNAWFRQLNTETFRDTNVLNNGGDVWVHGFKSERTTTAFKTVGGGQTEVMGAFHLGQWPGATDVPIYNTIDSALSATFRSRGSAGNNYQTTATEERGASSETIDRVTLPSSALLTSYPSGFTKPSNNVVAVQAVSPVSEEKASPVNGTYTVYRYGDLSSPLTVDYTMNGDATNGSDYTTLSGSLSFAIGEGEKTVTLAPLNDGSAEGTESAVLSIDADAAYTLGWPAEAAITILDDDAAALGFDTADLTVWLREDFERAADGRVHNWLDRSGNDNHAFSFNLINNPRSPQWDETIFSGQGGLRFDVDYLQIRRSTDVANTSYSQRSLFAVIDTGDDVTSRQLIYKQGDSDSGFSLYLYAGKIYFTAWDLSGTAWGPHSVSGAVAAESRILVQADLDINSNVMEMRLNGKVPPNGLVSGITMNSIAPATETSSLGALYGTTRYQDTALLDRERGFGENPFVGTIGEFMIFNSILADSVRIDVQNTLTPRYDIPIATGIELEVIDPWTTESDSPATIHFVRTGDATTAINIGYTLSGSAINGSDYSTLSGSVFMDAGVTIVPLQIAAIDDDSAEPTETVQIDITAGAGYELGGTTAASLEIFDNDVVQPSAIELAVTPGSTTSRSITYTNIESSSQALKFSPVSGGEIESYVAKTDNDVGGPGYVWNDIKDIGTRIPTNSTSFNEPVTIGFNFPFYDRVFTTANVATSGYITFDDDPVNAFVQSLPSNSSSAIAPIISGIWSLIKVDGPDSGVFTHNPDPNTFVVQWENMLVLNSSSRLTFQLVLERNGRIRFYLNKYQNVTSGYKYSCGIQKAISTTNPEGIGIAARTSSDSFNTGFAHAGAVFEVSPQIPWLSTPADANLSASQIGDYSVGIDATGLATGTYEAGIEVSSDDPDYPTITIPITLNVENSGFTLWKETALASLAGGPYAQTGSNAEDDPESDGIANLMEYALGLDPLASDASGIPILASETISTEDYPSLEVTRTADRGDLIYTVEVSDDLIEWLSGIDHTVTVEDSGTALRVRSATPLSTAPKQFLRLKVERP